MPRPEPAHGLGSAPPRAEFTASWGLGPRSCFLLSFHEQVWGPNQVPGLGAQGSPDRGGFLVGGENRQDQGNSQSAK